MFDRFPVEDITHYPTRKQGDWAKDDKSDKSVKPLGIDNLPSQFTVETIISTLNKLIASGDKLTPLYKSIVGYMQEHHEIKAKIAKLTVENNQLKDNLDFYKKMNDDLGEEKKDG